MVRTRNEKDKTESVTAEKTNIRIRKILPVKIQIQIPEIITLSRGTIVITPRMMIPMTMREVKIKK